MAVAVRVIGSTRRINPSDDEAMLALCEKVAVGNKGLKMIPLRLNQGVIRGGSSGSYKLRGFQTVDIVINSQNGTQTVKYTQDAEGNDTSNQQIKFTPDGFGGRYAHIPDTSYNRDILVKTFERTFAIVDETVEKEIKKDAVARLKRRDNAMEKAIEKASSLIKADRATFITGLKNTLGAGYEQSREYKDSVAKDIKTLARRYFLADQSWESKKQGTEATKVDVTK